MTIIYIFSGILLLVTIIIIALYNRLVIRKNEVSNAFGSIDAMLKKRFDLLPNLVEITKQYMNYEKDVLTDITALRSQINKSNISTNEKIEKYNELQKRSDGIFFNIENYPNLKANESFKNLQKAWNTTEEQISASRRFYNSAVTEYNNAVQAFPSNIIAGLFNFTTLKVFEIAEEERKNISAKKLFS